MGIVSVAVGIVVVIIDKSPCGVFLVVIYSRDC